MLQISQRTALLQRNGGLPARETCELLVLDRSVDPVAPVIHEWTYEALVYDLLSLDDNIIRCVCVSATQLPHGSWLHLFSALCRSAAVRCVTCTL